MQLNDLFINLAFSELATIGGVSNGTLSADLQARVIVLANKGLTELHTRFPLRKETTDLTITLATQYPLGDTCLKVLSVTCKGIPLPINALGNADSVMLPMISTMVVPAKYTDSVLTVEYQADCPRVSATQTLLEIPVPLEAALGYFIGYKIFSGIGTQEANIKAQELMSMYDNSLSMSTNAGTATAQESSSGEVFSLRGWV